MNKILLVLTIAALFFTPMTALAANKPVSLQKIITKQTKVAYPKFSTPIYQKRGITRIPKKIDHCEKLYIIKGKWMLDYGSEELIVDIGLKQQENTCEVSYKDSDGDEFKATGTSLPITKKKAFGNYDVTIGYNEYKQMLTLSIGGGNRLLQKVN